MSRPQIVTRPVQVPTQLAVTRSADKLSVAIDPHLRETAELAIDPQLIAGVRYALRVRATDAPIADDRGGGLAGGLDFDVGERIFNTAQDGFPRPGVHYVVEIQLDVFETDVPPGHEWQPESDRFRVVWTRTLSRTVD